ncbi:MAG: DUF3782 domain-containing protein [bacterium]
MKQMREETNRRFEEHRKEMLLGFTSVRDELHVRITTIGSRWGKELEGTVRNIFKELLFKRFEVKEIERWECFDESGIVYSHPSSVEADILMKNGECYLVEIASSCKKADAGALEQKALLYQKKKGILPKKVLVAVEIEKDAIALCKDLGIQLITYDEIKEE